MKPAFEPHYLKLIGNDWLDDDLIGRYLQLVVTYGNKIGQKCFAFSSHILDLCHHFGHHKYILIHGRVLTDNQLVFIPVHVPGHWILYIYDKQSNVLEFYDSNGGNERRLDEIKKFLSYFLKEYEIVKKDVHFQEDSFNCGIFLCIFAKYRLLGNNIKEIRNLILKKERYKILTELTAECLIFSD
ncbi:peptidase C48 domain-containing protein [Pseudoloma neurophilia]|uniref:Peptidase C48 domain-containing protein n=1 Tax=Pseudoloma neurophilia TaxID=146866 RepID=A0A0R0M3I2_9MICR|nr:peptidase C48 domain-containing protein [Pseudoloma neurophilia]